VYHPLGFPQRALVIVGPDGLVKWSYQAPTPLELPGANLIFDGLQQAAA
jgi:peroxiredoxin (alkyl hydroperoxide reductase subunit C)